MQVADQGCLVARPTKKATDVAFFLYMRFTIKKVGVPADLDLVSTCEGDARVGEAIPERLGMTQGEQ